jgi:hypothetical protein
MRRNGTSASYSPLGAVEARRSRVERSDYRFVFGLQAFDISLDLPLVEIHERLAHLD